MHDNGGASGDMNILWYLREMKVVTGPLDVEVAQFFEGKAVVRRYMEKRGYPSVGFDIEKSQYHDANSSCGLIGMVSGCGRRREGSPDTMGHAMLNMGLYVPCTDSAQFARARRPSLHYPDSMRGLGKPASEPHGGHVAAPSGALLRVCAGLPFRIFWGGAGLPVALGWGPLELPRPN